jgi:hypothetical protein
MSGQKATVEPIVVTPIVQPASSVNDEQDAIEHAASDVHRSRGDEKIARARKRLFDALHDPRRRKYAYIRAITHWARKRLTNAEVRVLHAAIEDAGADLDNSFASHPTIGERIGITGGRVQHVMAVLRKKGFVVHHDFQREADNGYSSCGIEFRLPEGIVGPLPWQSDPPPQFNQRNGVFKVRRRSPTKSAGVGKRRKGSVAKRRRASVGKRRNKTDPR